MIHEFIYKNEIRSLELKDNRIAVFPESGNNLEIERTPDGRLFLRHNGGLKEIFAAVNGDKTYVDVEGVLYEFAIPKDDATGAGGAGGSLADPSRIMAPMPGKVVKIMVKVGDTVEEKQQLVIVEAMKMENIISAMAPGVVKAVNFAEGDQCDTETPIVELEPNE